MGEFSKIHDSAIGRPLPAILGANSLTGDTPGAIEALYVNTDDFIYQCAGGSLHSVPEVYSNGIEKATPGDYVIANDGDGRTYIDFVDTQGDNIVTFNATGYMFAPWNSTNGYVQNPAYIIAFYLAFIVGFPGAYFNWPSFTDMANLFEDGGWGKIGRLIIQDIRPADDVLRELLFTFGVKLWFTTGGLLTIGRKDIADFSTSTYVFTQIDALEQPDRKENFENYVNHSNSRYDFYPASGMWKGAEEKSRDKSIEDFGATRDPSPPWDFPWTTSTTFVQSRLTEELMKFGYGDKRLTVVLPLRFFDKLDIFSDFRFQDPFAPSAAPGSGEIGRYYYVESVDPDPLNNRFTIKAVDFQWLLRQYCIAGDEGSLALNWDVAPDADRMYCYACDEDDDLFDDDEPGKILVDENLLGTD